MKRLFCSVLICFALIGCSQADSPSAIVLKGEAGMYDAGMWAVAFSPDGKKVITAESNAPPRIWSVDSGKELQRLPEHKDVSLSLAFSPDGNVIATVDFDVVRIWDADSGKELRKLKGHTHVIAAISFSSDGKKIATASYDKTARIWDVESGEELQKIEESDCVTAVALSPDGRKIVTGASSFHIDTVLWDVESGKELHKLKGHSGGIHSAAFSPDGKKIVTAGMEGIGGTVRIWDADSGKELYIQKVPVNAITNLFYAGEHTNWVNSVVFSPDGEKIVTADSEGTIRIYDAELKAELQKLKGHTKDVPSVAISPDGKKIASASHDGTARIWTLE